jgi:NAD(P)-dependent dehydrogenase (short-subunit alcohol dehydrogenase family)
MSFRAGVVSRGMNDLLSQKNAIVYGAAGSLGSAVARTFARHGATVHLVGRTRETLDTLAAEIGERAHVAVLDALDERAVDGHAAAVAAQGGVHVSFNLIFRGDRQGTPLVDMTLDDYLGAITAGVSTAFLTARAAARHMAAAGGGAILHLTSGSSRGAQPGMGNTGPLDAATEAFHRYLAAEAGPSGVRVVGIHTAAVRGTLTPEKIERVSGARGVDVEMISQHVAGMTMLRRAPEVQQIADLAAFLASDGAGAVTSGIVNATCGLVAG